MIPIPVGFEGQLAFLIVFMVFVWILGWLLHILFESYLRGKRLLLRYKTTKEKPIQDGDKFIVRSGQLVRVEKKG